MLAVEALGTLPALWLEGFDRVTGLLHRAVHEPADGMFSPTHGLYNLPECGTVLALQHPHHLGRLAAHARPRLRLVASILRKDAVGATLFCSSLSTITTNKRKVGVSWDAGQRTKNTLQAICYSLVLGVEVAVSRFGCFK